MAGVCSACVVSNAVGPISACEARRGTRSARGGLAFQSSHFGRISAGSRDRSELTRWDQLGSGPLMLVKKCQEQYEQIAGFHVKAGNNPWMPLDADSFHQKH